MSTNTIPPYSTLLWVKTPKCGGTSLKGLLKEHKRLFVIEDPWTVQQATLEKEAGQHKIIMVRNGQLRVLARRFPEWVEDAHVFMIVRNPWDRFISGWKYCRSTYLRPLPDVCAHPPRKQDHLHDWHHLTQPLYRYAQSDEGAILVDQFVKLEHLNNELQPLLEAVGLGNKKLSRHNRSHRKKDYVFYYRTQEWERVGKLFEQDITLFGYADIPTPVFGLRHTCRRISECFRQRLASLLTVLTRQEHQ